MNINTLLSWASAVGLVAHSYNVVVVEPAIKKEDEAQLTQLYKAITKLCNQNDSLKVVNSEQQAFINNLDETVSTLDEKVHAIDTTKPVKEIVYLRPDCPAKVVTLYPTGTLFISKGQPYQPFTYDKNSGVIITDTNLKVISRKPEVAPIIQK